MAWNSFDSSMQGDGGFMNTSISAGTGNENSNIKRAQNIVPLMIAHIIRHGEKITVSGLSVRTVTFLGIVRKLEVLSTKASFEFEDETGTIKGIKWLDTDNSEYDSPVQINTYARVYGSIREQNEETFILIINIAPMKHLNELLTHLQEVTLVTLESIKTESQGGISDNRAQSIQDLQSDSIGIPGLNVEQNIVMDIIKNCDVDYGAERNEIKLKVPPSIKSKVDEILEFLSAEGHVYTTKTDDYFKAI